MEGATRQVSDTANATTVPSSITAPGVVALKLSESAGGAIAEQLARIEQVVWSTPVAAAIEPWVTPRWVSVDPNRTTGEANIEQHR